MKRINEHEIERRLAEDRVPTPPGDLAQRIKAEIPAELPAFPLTEENVVGVRRPLVRRLLLTAAGVVIIAGTGTVAWRVLRPELPGLAPSAAVDRRDRAQAFAVPKEVDRTANEQPETAAPAKAAAVEKGEEAGAVSSPESEARPRTAGGGATLTVSVSDGAAPLAGAKVALARIDTADKAVRSATTSVAGLAVFGDVVPGSYSVTAALMGFRMAVAENVVIEAGTTPTVKVILSSGTWTEPTVIADATAFRDSKGDYLVGSPTVIARVPVSTSVKIKPPERKAVADQAVSFPVPESGTSNDEDRRRAAERQYKAGEEQKRYEELGRTPEQGMGLTASEASPMSADKKQVGSTLTVVNAQIPPAGYAPPSTGGTAEPNDRPYGDVFFQHYGVNPFIDTSDDTLSTFGLDVDTGSYTVARRYLADGNLPDPASIRVEEWVNYFDYGDRPARRGDFAITAEGAPTPFGENDRYHVLRFGIRGRVIDESQRKPAVLTFVVDVSGSMAREDRLGLVKKSLFALLERLRPSDEVALVVYGSRGQVVLEPTEDHERIRSAIDRLQPGGSTNAEEGLVLAYDLAGRAFRRDAINRVILCSDGVANVGRTGPESILGRIEHEAQRGIELTTVGFGMGNYNDVLMEQLADKGNGRYAYVDTFKEARRIFVENLTGTLQTIAVNAKVQVEFNPEVVARYRLLGYENRDIADEKFRDDTVDAGEIGAGHAVTALYEIKLREKPAGGQPAATLRLRYRPAESREFVEVAHQMSMRDIASSWEKASPALKLASLVAEVAEILKGSYWAKVGDLDDVFRRAQQLSPSFPGNADVAEFVSLAGTAARLKAPPPSPVPPRDEDR